MWIMSTGVASGQQLQELAAALGKLQKEKTLQKLESANNESSEAERLFQMIQRRDTSAYSSGASPPMGHSHGNKTLPSSMGRNQTECKYGVRCTREGCWYFHPHGKHMDTGVDPHDRRDRFERRSMDRRSSSGKGTAMGWSGNFLLEDNTNDYCEHCREGGDLLCCDNCARVFHLLCLDPPIHAPPTSYWTCPVCTRGSGRETNIHGLNRGRLSNNNQFGRPAFINYAGNQRQPPEHGGFTNASGCGNGNIGGRCLPPPNYICKRCQKPGHFLQDCPTNVCFKCGGEGHIASKCQGQRTEEGQRKRQREEFGEAGAHSGGGGGGGGGEYRSGFGGRPRYK